MNKLIKTFYNSQIFSRYYHPNVIKHYENPKNVGSLNKDDKDVGSGFSFSIATFFCFCIINFSFTSFSPSC